MGQLNWACCRLLTDPKAPPVPTHAPAGDSAGAFIDPGMEMAEFTISGTKLDRAGAVALARLERVHERRPKSKGFPLGWKFVAMGTRLEGTIPSTAGQSVSYIASPEEGKKRLVDLIGVKSPSESEGEAKQEKDVRLFVEVDSEAMSDKDGLYVEKDDKSRKTAGQEVKGKANDKGTPAQSERKPSPDKGKVKTVPGYLSVGADRKQRQQQHVTLFEYQKRKKKEREIKKKESHYPEKAVLQKSRLLFRFRTLAIFLFFT